MKTETDRRVTKDCAGMERDVAEFAVYAINCIAAALKVPTPEVYAALDDSGCLENYLAAFYDVLHTMGSEAIVEDLTGYLRNRGYKL